MIINFHQSSSSYPRFIPEEDVFLPQISQQWESATATTPEDSCVSSLHTRARMQRMKMQLVDSKQASNHANPLLRITKQPVNLIHLIEHQALSVRSPEQPCRSSTCYSRAQPTAGSENRSKKKIRSSGEGEEIAHRSIRFNGPRGAAAADSHQPRR